MSSSAGWTRPRKDNNPKDRLLKPQEQLKKKKQLKNEIELEEL